MTHGVSESQAPVFLMQSTEARSLTDKIRAGLEGIYQLIIEAYRGKAWTALGYGTWDEYIHREFGNQPLRPPLENREEVVQSLRSSGMSTRAIASATELSPRTVRRSLTPSPGAFAPPESTSPSTITGQDGKEYSSSKPSHSPSTKSEDVGVLNDVLDAPAESAGVILLDPQERQQQKNDRTEKILFKFHGSESAALEQTMFLAEKIAGLVSPVTAEIDVSKTAYGDVAKDIAAAIRQFAYVAKTLAGARTEFANKKLLDVLIDDLGRATDDLASTVAQLEDKKQ